MPTLSPRLQQLKPFNFAMNKTCERRRETPAKPDGLHQSRREGLAGVLLLDLHSLDTHEWLAGATLPGMISGDRKDLTPLNFTNLLNNSKSALDDLNEPLNAYDFPLSQCHLNDSPYEEICKQQPPCEPSSKKAAAPRQANFSIEEDKLLVSAWLNISLDPVKPAKRNNNSGKELQNTLKTTRRGLQKWMDEHQNLESKRQQQKVRSSKSHDSINLEDDLEAPEPASLKRPIGRKVAKEANKKAKSNDEGGTNEKESKIRSELKEFRAKRLESDRIKVEQFKLLLDTQKKEVALKEKELELQAQSEKIGIMSMDTSKMLPHQVEYFIGLQKEILAKRVANGNE
ncbi:hypothetical protein ACLB2K_049971 [Fragaria x ananassa]